MTLFAKAKAFVLGLLEFTHGMTSELAPPLDGAYERGRECAHRLTLHIWDDGRRDDTT
jgi:hypothetical protein